MLLVALALISAAGCQRSDASDFYWYEEAMQDDGTIVVVKKIESRSHKSRLEPCANNYGYRSPRMELTDPKTGGTISWNPKNLPPLLPYALHVHDKVPYVFAKSYLYGAYRDLGCPTPPYIVFRWDVDRWNRIRLHQLPTIFRRHNLLSGAHTDVAENGIWSPIKQGRTVKAQSIAMYVRSISSESASATPYDRYEREIQYQDIGPYDDLCTKTNQSTQYDNVEIK
jgi:hypothetical protein